MLLFCNINSYFKLLFNLFYKFNERYLSIVLLLMKYGFIIFDKLEILGIKYD